MYYLLLFTLLIILVYFILNHSNYIEGWQDYTLKPYNYVLSGSDPLYFYRYDRYRKPYRCGFKFFQSYPYPHLTQHQ